LLLRLLQKGDVVVKELPWLKVCLGTDFLRWITWLHHWDTHNVTTYHRRHRHHCDQLIFA